MLENNNIARVSAVFGELDGRIGLQFQHADRCAVAVEFNPATGDVWIAFDENLPAEHFGTLDASIFRESMMKARIVEVEHRVTLANGALPVVIMAYDVPLSLVHTAQC